MAVSHHFRLSCWCWGVCPYSGMTDCRAEWVLLVPSQWAFPASLHVFLSCGKLTIRFHMILIRPIKLDIAFSDFQGNTFPFNSSFAPASGQTILLKHTGRHRWKFLTLMFSWLQWDGAYRMLHLFCIYTACSGSNRAKITFFCCFHLSASKLEQNVWFHVSNTAGLVFNLSSLPECRNVGPHIIYKSLGYTFKTFW